MSRERFRHLLAEPAGVARFELGGDHRLPHPLADGGLEHRRSTIPQRWISRQCAKQRQHRPSGRVAWPKRVRILALLRL